VEGNAAGNPEYGEALRELIDSVTIRPGLKPGQVEVEIKGRLNVLLGHNGGST
jgi:hypothetical protein